MAKIAGRSGFVAIGASTTPVAGINQWAIDYTVDMLETTDFSASGIASYIPGISRWSGTFSGYKDGVPQSLGVSSSVSMHLAESNSASQIWTGLAYISGIHPTTNYDGIVSYAYDFQGTGALAVASA